MRIIFIAAMSENRVIGKAGKLPWHLPNDLRHFQKLTLHQHILMGRKTFLSLKQPLKHRSNYVLTRNNNIKYADVSIFHSKEEVLQSGLKEVMIIGGEEIFKLFLPECVKIYLTIVHSVIDGDSYFPRFNNFIETNNEYHHRDDTHKYDYSFITYIKNDLKIDQ